MKNRTKFNLALTEIAREWRALLILWVLRSGKFIHIWCKNLLTSDQKRDRNRALERRGDYAKRTARAKTPGGRDRQCSSHCPHCDRRRTGNIVEATSQAQERFGGCKGTSGVNNSRRAQDYCAKGCRSEVGLMPFDFPAFHKSGWAYRDCYTIDPQKGAWAWEKLNLNQLGLEIGMLPRTLHFALLETLKERKTLEKTSGNGVD
ncbi:hypothetical protein [Roseovarius pelagicus]|uniref:Uncharacterized protein n=1 Tax=Roseovarius pelagicus TaxID=2980108 RepID=A0ABY6DCX4_9RHOB|nr:hypothetical protein [Roseovarius pelagicus]UXX83920.1 hypothetical protein N7U68_04485 [Roseovarius pelagicus]